MQEVRPVRIVHSVGGLHRSLGGTSRAVAEVCEALAARDLDITLLSLLFQGEGELVPLPHGVTCEFVNARRIRTLRQVLARGFGGTMSAVLRGRRPAVFHDHGLWLSSNLAAVRAAGKAGVPFVVAPHGMVSDWALGQRRWAKRAAWQVYQRKAMADAAVIHATSGDEAECVRRLGVDTPIALVPNGVKCGQFPFDETAKDAGAERRALFLSRLHPKKGLENLIDAWAIVEPSGWQLDIVGPGTRAYRSKLHERIRDRGVSESIEISDEVDDHERRLTYGAANLFVLPTLSENFGIVVAEALASGVPVITTTAAPWAELVARRCGWWVEPTVGALVEALRQAIELPAETLVEMGRRGRRLVESSFSWGAAAASLDEVYAWLSGADHYPACMVNKWNCPSQTGLEPCT